MKILTIIFVFVIAFSSSVQSQDLNSGLVAQYTFSGNSYNKVSNRFHGSVNGASLDSDRFGNSNSAYKFDGIDDYIEVKDDENLRPNNISISFWVNLTAEKQSWQAIISKFNSNETSNGNYVIATQGFGNIHSAFHNGNMCSYGDDWNRHGTSINWNLGKWEHIVVTYGDSYRTYYQNGVQIQRDRVNVGANNCTGSPLRIGGTYWTNSPQFFEGKLDDIRIYERALSSREVGVLYSLESKSGEKVNDDYILYNELESKVSSKENLIGKKVVLKNIRFQTGSDKLDPSSFEMLNNIANILDIDKSLNIEVSGHTDDVGNDTDNYILSQKRADAVKYYLISKAINPSRINSIGKGEKEPISTDLSVNGRKLNRRVEMKFIK